MAAYSNSSSLAAYQSVAAHGGVSAADPHQLVVMLMDGALDRIAGACGAIQNGQAGQKARLIHKAVEIINELHASVNTQDGGAIAVNLRDLYDYMARQLVRANMETSIAPLDEVAKLLREIRSAWIAIPGAARGSQGAR